MTPEELAREALGDAATTVRVCLAGIRVRAEENETFENDARSVLHLSRAAAVLAKATAWGRADEEEDE